MNDRHRSNDPAVEPPRDGDPSEASLDEEDLDVRDAVKRLAGKAVTIDPIDPDVEQPVEPPGYHI